MAAFFGIGRKTGLNEALRQTLRVQAAERVLVGSGIVGDWQKVLTGILGACFGGGVVTFMSKQLGDAKAMSMYPVGVVVAYTWSWTPVLRDLSSTGEG